MTGQFGTRRVLILALLMMASAISLPSPVAASAAPQTELQRVLEIASHQIGDRYAFASTGPNTFDCSGLVYYVYKEAGLLDRIGGKRSTVAGLHRWFLKNGSVTKGIATARPGDVLIWGRNQHAGIYIGDNMAISTLVNPWGVKLHRFDWIHLKLTAVLHVDLER